MELRDVELMICPAGTPVLAGVDCPRPDRHPGQTCGATWHPGSKTWCDHGEPMPFPSQPAVSPLHLLRQRLGRLADGLASGEFRGNPAAEIRKMITPTGGH